VGGPRVGIQERSSQVERDCHSIVCLKKAFSTDSCWCNYENKCTKPVFMVTRSELFPTGLAETVLYNEAYEMGQKQS
jgi:hypothetical protein